MWTLKISMVSAIIAAMCAATVLAAGPGHGWSYAGEHGPQHWGGLQKDYVACKNGKAQSPIDIHGAVPRDLPPIRFDYRATPLRIVDNGHTIQVNTAPGSAITVGGRRYELMQFHFHKPSEEKLDGEPFAMVAHLVHKHADDGLAVVAVLLKQGTENAFIKALWNNLPPEKEKEHAAAGVSITPDDLLPRRRAYYSFAGSLTTPPCSEHVNWFVLADPVEISATQVARFGSIYSNNARPVQPLNGRTIMLSR